MLGRSATEEDPDLVADVIEHARSMAPDRRATRPPKVPARVSVVSDNTAASVRVLPVAPPKVPAWKTRLGQHRAGRPGKDRRDSRSRAGRRAGRRQGRVGRPASPERSNGLSVRAGPGPSGARLLGAPGPVGRYVCWGVTGRWRIGNSVRSGSTFSSHSIWARLTMTVSTRMSRRWPLIV